MDGTDLGVDAHVDSAVDSNDGGTDAGLQACGNRYCSRGQHCCATCPGESDVCIPETYNCPVADEYDCQPIDCPEAMDVDNASVGECETVLGYWWAGLECLPLTGCSCVGDICEELFSTLDECDSTHSGCDLCGTVSNVACADGSFCRFTGPIDRCVPLADLWGRCVPIPDTCDPGSDPVCACDGSTYSNPCVARMALQTLDHLGPCEP